VDEDLGDVGGRWLSWVMLGTTVLDDMGEDEVLAFAGTCAETQLDADIGLLRAAYKWAIIHGPDRLDPDETGRAGREKARLYGGDGTPEVTEFAAAALGARIGRTTFAAARLMADALDLHHRATDLWARVEAGEVRVSYARFVVKQTRHLPAAEAQAVATAVAPYADGRIPWTRFENLVEGAVAKADPKAAREKEERAAQATFARKLRTDAHGMASFLARGPLPWIEQIAAVVKAYSEALRDYVPDLSHDERDLLALLMLLTPGADQNPAALAEHTPVVNLYVHTYAGTDHPDGHEGINRLEGHGPVTDQWVRETLGPPCRFKIYPVIDLAGQAPVDAYEIPDRHRQAVQLMTPADTFPYSSSLSRTMQVDHTVPYDEGGASGVGNYGPMTVPHHRIKTHGAWDVNQPFPGIYIWRDPHGAYYLVDHTGTRRIPKAADDLPLVVEIYRDLPAVELDWDAA
jgi:hypothetical protein